MSGRSTKQTKNESVLKLVSFVIFLTMVNMAFFYLYRNREIPVMCTADSVVNSAVQYLLGGGNISLAKAIPSECPQAGKEVSNEFSKAIHSLNRECRKTRQQKREHLRPDPKPLLTLFTTFSGHVHNNTEKYIVHNNTIANWAALKPSVNLILFSNDSKMRQIALAAGWDLVTSVNESAEVPPVLKDMFQIAMATFKTPWYGYSNGDILFVEDFISTLKEINETFDSSQRVLITGRRTNVENLTTDIDVTDFLILRKFAEARGKLHKTDAEDYFITSRSFPWNETAPVVIGRPAFDNWLVGHARCNLKSVVIDATDTLFAVHQTTKHGGNHEGYRSRNPNVNFEIFKKLNMKTNFIAGLTPCCNYRTYESFCGIITADARAKLDKGCECK